MSHAAQTQAWEKVDDLPPRQFIVLLAIADVVNDAHHNLFWMSSAALAKKAGASRATAAAALADFVKRGWMEVVTPSDRHRPTEYRWLITGSVQNLDTSEVSNLEAPIAPEVSNPDDRSVQSTDPTPLSIPREPKSLQTNPGNGAYPPEFQSAWKHYPRKTEKADAFRCWEKLVKKGTDPADLVAACQHYAEAMRLQGRDPTLVKHGATFFGPKRSWESYVEGVPADEVPRPKQDLNGRRKAKDERLFGEHLRRRANQPPTKEMTE